MQREKHSSQKAHKSRTALRMDWCLHSSHIFAEGWENERVKGEWGNENRNKQGNQDLQLKCCHLISTILFALLRSTFFLCVLCIFVICYIFFVCVFFLKHTHTHTFFFNSSECGSSGATSPATCSSCASPEVHAQHGWPSFDTTFATFLPQHNATSAAPHLRPVSNYRVRR